MRIAIAASEIPHPQGSAAGRDLWAWCEGMRSLGHDVDAWIWRLPDPAPRGELPSWARLEPVDFGPSWRAHLRGLATPRNDAALGTWRPAPDAVAVADHVWSIGAVLGHPRSVTILHFRVLADALALRHVTPAQLQTARAERRAARRSRLVLAYSDRVAHGLPRPACVVPIAHPVPDAPVPVVEEPVASLLANWKWPPNRRALDSLLGIWPAVRAQVPGARLLVGGRHLPVDAIGAMAGVEVVGEVADSSDILASTAVVPFACPASSGPKVKVLEALMHGVPVVTTPAGMEGIAAGPDSAGMVVDERGFAARLVALLRDPARRERLGAGARQAVAAHHAPVASAHARLRAFGRLSEE